jgi:hypothetical protein
MVERESQRTAKSYYVAVSLFILSQEIEHVFAESSQTRQVPSVREYTQFFQ